MFWKGISSIAVLSVLAFLCGCNSVQPDAKPQVEAKQPSARISLQKLPERDFVVLNISDPQLSSKEWLPGSAYRRILLYTLEELVGRVQPDLITITGDLSWAGHDKAYDALASYLDSFGIPWAPVWGNHDNQKGDAYIRQVAERYMKHPYCKFAAGAPALGCGNYVITIDEGEKKVAALFMMDTHDSEPRPTPEKPDAKCWSKLKPPQLEWYRQQANELKSLGYSNSAMFMHIPIFGYRQAFEAAFQQGVDFKKLSYEESKNSKYWKPGYEKAFGCRHEGICSFPEDEGALDVLLAEKFTSHLIAGHDHVNNFMIPYKGIQFIYSMKAGAGCYWESHLNGGTVLQIDSDGSMTARHELVNVEHLVPLLPKKK